MMFRSYLLIFSLSSISASAVAADVVKEARYHLGFTQTEQTVFLADMRVMLQTVQDIVNALAKEDREAMIKAAKLSGNQMARNTPMSIKKKLPASFQAIGGPMHLGFEEFAIRAETDDIPELTAHLGQLMGKCMACHAAFTVK